MQNISQKEDTIKTTIVKKIKSGDTTVFKAEDGYKGAHYDHFFNWVRAIRGGKPVMEDGVFGYRAAAPCTALQ